MCQAGRENATEITITMDGCLALVEYATNGKILRLSGRNTQAKPKGQAWPMPWQERCVSMIKFYLGLGSAFRICSVSELPSSLPKSNNVC